MIEIKDKVEFIAPGNGVFGNNNLIYIFDASKWGLSPRRKTVIKGAFRIEIIDFFQAVLEFLLCQRKMNSGRDEKHENNDIDYVVPHVVTHC